MKRKNRIPSLLQYFQCLQNHAPQILETSCQFDMWPYQYLCKVKTRNVSNGDGIRIVPLNIIPWKIGKEQTRVALKELNTWKSLSSKPHITGLEIGIQCTKFWKETAHLGKLVEACFSFISRWTPQRYLHNLLSSKKYPGTENASAIKHVGAKTYEHLKEFS
jgi:hypothetical protein